MPPTDPLQLQLKEWLSAAGRQDAAAFRKLYLATSPKLFGFALRILKKREWAEEALQDSFVSIWNHAGQYQQAVSAPMTWMTTIVRNKCLDMLRRLDDKVRLEADFDEPDMIDRLESEAPGPTHALALSADAKALAACMRRLEGLHRQAIALAFYHDLSHSEVAQQLKLPIGTVKTWIRRGLERLRSCLSGLENK